MLAERSRGSAGPRAVLAARGVGGQVITWLKLKIYNLKK